MGKLLDNRLAQRRITLIFCVEDDKNIRELITYTLKTIGLDASGFCDAKELFNELESSVPKMFLLDIMLPDVDGIEILKKLKNNEKTKNIPVIMITAKGSEIDKVTGLDLGADDYISKPFGMMEMVSRVKAVLRRCEKNQPKHNTISHKNLLLDTQKHTVKVDDKLINLSFKEYEVLKLLLENKGLVLTRDQILNNIWGYDYDGENRTVDVHIRTLRQKLGEQNDIIKTIRNVGYKAGE